MKTIGVLARKGGAGKSTLTLHWAVEAERQGRGKVAVIDMDPQQTSVPHVEAPCREAAKLVDLVVIPCGPSAPDLESIGATIHILQETKTPGVIVLNQGRPGSSINHKAVAVLKQYGLSVCSTQVMRRAALADAFTDGRAVVELEPNGKAAAEITQSWKWIVKQVT
jgi:chromosome partitioning protein